MAAVNPTVNGYVYDGDHSVRQIVWVLDSTNDRGAGVFLPEWINMTWHVAVDSGGSLGGGTVVVETAPYDTDASYAPCSNAAGGAAIGISGLVQGAVGKVAVSVECCGAIRPRLNTSTGATGVRVTLTAFRSTQMRQ